MLFIIKLQSVHGLFSHLLVPAFKGAAFLSSKVGASTSDVDDPALRMDVCWHDVAGKRYKRTVEFMNDRWAMFVLRTLVVVQEIYRGLTRSFMAASNNTKSFVGFSPIMDMLYEPTSHLVWALQYLSSLLRGTPSRTRLLWQPGYNSYVEWVRGE